MNTHASSHANECVQTALKTVYVFSSGIAQLYMQTKYINNKMFIMPVCSQAHLLKLFCAPPFI